MNRRRRIFATVILVLLFALAFEGLSLAGNGNAPAAIAQGGNPQAPDAPTAIVSREITYQGQLKFGGAPLTALCDMAFRLYDAAALGSVQGNVITASVPVTQGLFTAALDFGPFAWSSDQRWLDTMVRCPSGPGAFTSLAPRQQLRPAPYALNLAPGARMVDDSLGHSFTVQNGWPGGIWLVDRKAISAWTSDGTALFGAAGTGFGVLAFHGASTGTNAAVHGESASTVGSASAVLGKISSSAPGGFSAGVRGINNGTGGSGIGVYGSHSGSGWGVYGYAPTGVGVYATSAGTSINSPALYAINTNAGGTEPAGIAVYARSQSVDATVVAHNVGTGDTYRALSSAGGVVYRVTNSGRVVASVVQITGGADLAEKFAIADEAPQPGTLMVIDEHNPGRLRVSRGAYDGKVAGVVSGAGGVAPGVTLAQDGVLDGDATIAIAGRVYVQAEALGAPIRPGDLLTTSDLPGHAMKATDRGRAYGAVLGKAMSALDEGTGLVLVLVNLQ